MAELDDDAWLAALQGAHAGTSSAAKVETATRLRGAIRHVNRTTRVAHDPARELEQLLLRLRREGLLARERASPWKRFALPAVAAVVLAGVATHVVLQSVITVPPAPVLRGGPDMQVRDVADPHQAAQALQERLDGLGISSERHEIAGAIGVTATVPAAERERVAAALAGMSIELPTGSRLVVEFRPTAKR